jgi:hypothetical protein
MAICLFKGKYLEDVLTLPGANIYLYYISLLNPYKHWETSQMTFVCINNWFKVKPLNAELNSTCHLLILLDLTFMVQRILNIFQYISNKMQHYTVY